MNILEKINLQITTFSKSERKVAEVIIDNPEQAIHSSIATLAKIADVSEPTVNRFCRRLDTKGFPDFKLHLAQGLANGTPYVNRHVDEGDGPEEYTSKIFESTMASLNTARKSIDISQINRSVDILTQAKKISFFGLGASASVAQDALNKFFRFNVPINCFEDIVMQRMSCMNCTEGDVVVLFSHTGRTKPLVEIAEIARQNDATVIGVTAKDSPLAQECNICLSPDVPEDTDLYMPMASRIAHLVIVDILATGFTLRRGPKFRDNLKKVKDSLRSSRFEKKETFN
ncbi:MurR/RpiR family transcriptional regulator [Psychrosphaera sp. B3R10]|uniref:MurR/RpiR family transcriptional regulator n=1 Tax=unclassified Psychrosphaera TaxID=2641570 RepID=UPI001C0A289E|nr:MULTISPECIES: MurR/RpiR family transcriptional regulator [unclassified Psychrosphaera]MBU2882177.1 MurR/RpiR family transcriptional regulator [Psychrosphaera sp. I2R16]MBU2988858.1 MurR/RpiR family transcriptional regulator [Psychrosphaera sp. B3R10]MDO6717877.1 MurR/RpiR family transcriptional regulator [Psychrosphaera sp. 1_MG-2023]